MRTLIVYYSLSGNTRKIATALSEQLVAELEELRCSRYRRGFWGYLRAGRDSWRCDLPPIEPLFRDLADYDLVVIAGPIWAWHVATPVRAWLTREHRRLSRFALLLTHGGSGGDTSLKELEELVGRAPVATLVLREHDIKNGMYAQALDGFARQLRDCDGMMNVRALPG